LDNHTSDLLCDPEFSHDVHMQREVEQLDQRKKLLWLVLYITSTLLLVMLCEKVTLVFRCRCEFDSRPELYYHMPLSCLVLHGTNAKVKGLELPCYVGEHMYMLVATIVLLPLFVLVMWPLGLAGGDESLLDLDDHHTSRFHYFFTRLSPGTWGSLASRRRHLWTGALSLRVARSLAFQGSLNVSNIAVGISTVAVSRSYRRLVHGLMALVLLVAACVQSPAVHRCFTSVLRICCIGNVLGVAVAAFAHDESCLFHFGRWMYQHVDGIITS